MPRTTLILAGVLAGCAGGMAPRTHGGSAMALAQAGAAEGRIWVRPNELSWALGERVTFEGTVPVASVGRFAAGGVVLAEGGAGGARELPAHVALVATRELIGRGADGMLVTHWLADTTIDGTPSHAVRVWGRLLTLQDLGAMGVQRADLRRRLETLEAHVATEERPSGRFGVRP